MSLVKHLADRRGNGSPALDDGQVRGQLATRYSVVRETTEQLCRPLEIEDYQLQSMAECSPPKWHLAHAAWFFETFVLAKHAPRFRTFHPRYRYLFNSYYEAVGERWPRPQRGLLSRPTVAEIYAYRRSVDQQMLELIDQCDEPTLRAISPLIELGLNHEQQHQELLLTDLKHALGLNPLAPAYAPPAKPASAVDRDKREAAERWIATSGGVKQIGHDGQGFAFDNEGPQHETFVREFEIAGDLTTAGDYLAFIEDGGYDRHELWLSDGWAARQAHQWTAPLYWKNDAGRWTLFTLRSQRALDPAEPLCHVSYYEADAYARWARARLPTEAEWEVVASEQNIEGHFLESGAYHPAPRTGAFFGNVWAWTASPYAAYPGYRPVEGALGEYNAKFMCNQMVLRGGSCATPADHIRATYRNFFPPETRWQFAGVRLARDSTS